MDCYLHRVLLLLLLLPAAPLHAEVTFAVSPSVGMASINNIDGYNDTNYLRIDGTFFPLPQLGISLFANHYEDFESTGAGHDVAIRLHGNGVGVMGRWPLHPHVQPYLRADYMLWRADAIALGRTVGKEDGGSAGLAVGVNFPIKSIFSIKSEVSGYNDVSGADLRQFSLGAMFEF